jgi:hypothetical protein
MWTPRHRLVVLALLLGTLSEVGGLSARSDAQVHFVDLTTAHGVVDGRPFRPTHVFAPDDNPIYVWFRGEGCMAGTAIRSVWFYLETDPPLRFGDVTVVVDRPDDWGQFNFELGPGMKWRLGEYRIELRVDDALLAETRFRVSSINPKEL